MILHIAFFHTLRGNNAMGRRKNFSESIYQEQIAKDLKSYGFQR